MQTNLESLPHDSSRQGLTAMEDAWFLSGPTRAGEAVRLISVDENPFVVGRRAAAGTALALQFNTVSGTHASLSVNNGELFLRDLNSTNGTYVNGQRLGEVAVKVQEEDLIHFAEAPFRVRRQSPTNLNNGTIAENVCDQALALVQFDRLMSQRLVVPHFQPIVRLADGVQVGCEVLGRGRAFGLESVGAMFHAAAQLNLEVELSCLLRWEGIRVGRELGGKPTLFVNTHPKEMSGPGLSQSLETLREMAGNHQIVLEIHEAAVTEPAMMKELSAHLQDLEIQLAYDDFGSGQARLAELVEARPDYVKFDISLIRDIHKADEHRRKMIENLVRMVRDLGISALAEGVEVEAEGQVCRELEFDLAQGFYYGMPAPAEIPGLPL
ncbi:EAL domain-containing protein [Candidatus Laterigemmans baculatus]|uniref:EAL domain-containing protein n=1 Tax=Candidatus Laterigemmans baculatus TaxID=2770505 RepID=UPI0013DD1983|nr:EAL domain-containing protein [Candidatus Laterigemmans baculatus]